MIYEIFNIVLLIVLGWAVCDSTLVISEKKSRQRARTHDYYDNPIEEEENS